MAIEKKVDLSSAEFKRDPIPRFRELRSRGPILRVKLPLVGRCWITTNYEAADRVLRDQGRFCTDAFNAGHRTRTAMLGWLQWFLPRIVKTIMQNMLTMDEPDHRRLRSLVESAFARQSVNEMRPGIERIVDRQLDAMQDAVGQDGMVDLQNTFARRVPLSVICELLGLSADDGSDFEKWFDFTSPNGLMGILGALRRMGKLEHYLKERFAECRENPRPGMISALVHIEQGGDRLSEQELLGSVLILLLAGHETTTHLITVGLLALQQHPAERMKLMADWSKVESAIDEMLRFNSTIQTTKPRFARHDMEFYGQRIKQGEFFLPMLAAANYDPAVFSNPDRFDIDRTDNPHMAFGRGIHVCLGLKLAKAEAAIAFERLLRRFPDLRLAIPADQLIWSKRLGHRALRGLPVVLGPDARP